MTKTTTTIRGEKYRVRVMTYSASFDQHITLFEVDTHSERKAKKLADRFRVEIDTSIVKVFLITTTRTDTSI